MHYVYDFYGRRALCLYHISKETVVHNALCIFKQIFTNVTESFQLGLTCGSHSTTSTHTQFSTDVLTYIRFYHIELNLFVDLHRKKYKKSWEDCTMSLILRRVLFTSFAQSEFNKNLNHLNQYVYFLRNVDYECLLPTRTEIQCMVLFSFFAS